MSAIKYFLKLESASGIILFLMAIIAMIWANSPWAFWHQKFVEQSLFTINDGLMTIFFLLVGLELKREYLYGQLSQLSQVLLPFVAALGGMIIPAVIYWIINHHHPVAIKGWSIPVATDIAFALGVLSLFGKRIPSGLKLFLLALAIFDDIGAIAIIGVYYSQQLSYLYLMLALALVLLLFISNRFYLLIGVGLWFCLWRAGIHPTIAGVLLAFAMPTNTDFESRLHPYVAYFIMPIFALANAGFSLQGLTGQVWRADVVLGIVLGLFLGKQIGVFVFSWLAIRLGGAHLPLKTSWLALYGVSLLCGIGFTMSLFLGTLSFQYESAFYLTEVRLGVMVGSLLSGVVGAIVILFAQRRGIVG